MASKSFATLTDQIGRTAPNVIVRRVIYFQDQSDEVLAALAAVAVCLQYPAAVMILMQDEPATSLYYVEKGEVKISRLLRDGREHVFHIVRAGETFNDVAALDGGLNPATAITRTDVVVWRISRCDLQRLTSLYPSLAWALIESIARRARHLVGVVENLAGRNVRGRLAHLLLAEARRYETTAVPRMLTQEEMASRLGTVREMVGRALRGLAADGIIKFDRHRIMILDSDRLEKEAEV
ncbi:MAG: Crp/Fnr family transcriptional regulator [Chloroflexi bacterium]|nr:Crp/Fnr family transcriptional regulator [Chloroflexota bacterium]